MNKWFKFYQGLFNEVIQNHVYQPRICYYQIRSIKTEPKEDAEVIVYKRKDDEFKVSRAATVQRLINLLRIDQFEAMDIASKHKELCELTGVQLNENYKLCLDKGLLKRNIRKCINILAIKDLSVRLSIVRKIGNINDMAPLLQLSLLTLWKLNKDFEQRGNSIYYLADLLKVPPFEISEEFVRKPFLRGMKLTKMLDTVQLLEENNVTGRMIANDLTVLRYSLNNIKNKIAQAKECNVPDMKTWMIRADPKILSNYIRIRSDNKQILGDKTVPEYLSERLDCSLATAKYLVEKFPALNTKSMKKMTEIIDYLYSRGYSSTQICRVPKILLHSFETTKNRLEKLTTLGVEVNTLYMLIKSQKAFQEYYDNLVKILKKRKKLPDS